MSTKAAFAAALLIGPAVLVGPVESAQAGFVQSHNGQDPPATVQLNADTAVTHGLVNKYTTEDANVALGQCVTPGSSSAPPSTAFSSPVLTFTNYAFEPTLGVAANVTADAKLKPGTKAGTYQLTMTCNGKAYQATFTVPRSAAKQVSKIPAGAARAGGGGTAK